MSYSAFRPKSRNLDNLDDVLIVQKITAPDNLSTEDDYEEQNLQEEEPEILLKKQLQLLEADERGKQALISEIRAIKEKQEKRAQVVRNRQHALDIEKERAKKVAMLPPPLPASVKLLLRKNGNEPEPNKPEVQMPDELQVFRMEGTDCHMENKENVLSPEDLEAKQRLQEEWQKRAKKRFNEAIRKDRQKEEYSKVMKEIQNAELLNRREIARSIVSENTSIPCHLPDKFQMVQKQADIENASEKIFKKMNQKEHAIEDIEGYQDSYDEVFGKIDSGFESKMIDCVPSFVKENYEYLLEDDSKFQGGRNFTGLDESSNDVMNEAYIDSSPDYDRLSESRKLDEAIHHLDKLRSNIQTEYEQTLRPLLEAAINEQEAPKKDVCDKAVEAKILKMPVEHKAVGTEMPREFFADSPPLPDSNFLNSGVMAFRRRYEKPRLGSYNQMFVPPMHQRNVHYRIPSSPDTERLTPTSWSSSSYCSLPLQHGIPVSSTSSRTVKCDICVAEKEKELAKSNATPAPPKKAAQPDKVASDSSTSSLGRSKLSEYVQLIAAKYLDPPSRSQSDSALSLKSMAQSVNAAFEREVTQRFRGVSVTGHKSEEHPSIATDKPDTVAMTDDKVPKSNSSELLANKDIFNEAVDEINYERKKSDIAESSSEVSKYGEESAIGFALQILARRIPRFALDSGSPEEKSEDRPQQAVPHLSGQYPMSAKPYIYHELSTIHEVDSALTAESLQASRSKISNASAVSNDSEKIVDKSLDSSKDRIRTASLLDPPNSDVTDLAKSIHFVGMSQKEAVHPARETPVSSTNTQDPASVSIKKNSTMPSSLLSAPSISNDSVRSANRPYHKDPTLLAHFEDGRDTHLKDSNSEISGLSSLTPGLLSSSPFSFSSLSTPSMKTTGNLGSLTRGLFSSKFSSAVSLTGLSTPSMKSTGNTGSLESGFTDSPAITTYQSSLYVADKKSDASTSSSSPALSSIHFASTDSKSSRDEEQPSLLKSGSSGGSGKSEDSRKLQSIPPHFDISVPSSVRSEGSEIQARTPQSDISYPSAGSKVAEFQPMTPHSDFPSPSVGNESTKFQPMTPHSDFPSPSVGSASNKFEPMTPHSDFPSLSVTGASQPMTPQYNISGSTAENEGAKFQPMTPRSDISSPSGWIAGAEFQSNFEEQTAVRGKYLMQHGKEVVSSSSSESFAPMTPHSSISTPSEENMVHPDLRGYSKSAENFRALTPVSTLSTPRAAITHKNASSGSANLYPMKIRIDISSDSASCKSSSSNSTNNFPHLNYRLTVKAPVPDEIRYAESVAESAQNKVSGSPRIHLTDSPDKYHFPGKTSSKPEGKSIAAKVCSSGYFTPQIGLAEKQEPHKVESGRDMDKKDSQTEFIPESKQIPFLSTAASGADFQKGLLKSKKPAAKLSDDVQKLKKDLEEKFKEPTHSKNLWGKAGALNKPLGHFQLVSSSSSSTENLSEISGSKVLYQSTPIKSAEQIAQEPGILEEPDLTLMTTDYSCMVNATVRPNQTLKVADVKECILSPLGECKTPTNQSVHLTGSAATPSLLSFMQHELSCEDTEADTNAESMKLTPVASESKTDSKQRPATQIPKYRERTKRLYNNLEEVRKKKEFEDRRKFRTESRLKAKEYAKKLTPVRK